MAFWIKFITYNADVTSVVFAELRAALLNYQLMDKTTGNFTGFEEFNTFCYSLAMSDGRLSLD